MIRDIITAVLSLCGSLGAVSCSCHNSRNEIVSPTAGCFNERARQAYRLASDPCQGGIAAPWPVWQAGDHGPPVLLLCDIAGARPQCLELGRYVSLLDGGYRVYVPLLFGSFGKPVPATLAGISARFHGWILSHGRIDQPNLADLEALCGELHRKSGHRVIVVGNCLTGGVAVSLLRSPYVCASVTSQPTLPFFRTGSIDVSATTLQAIKLRFNEATGPKILGLNFHRDRVQTHARFSMLKRDLGTLMRAVDFCESKSDYADAAAQRMDRIYMTSDSTQHSVLIPPEDEARPPHYPHVEEELRRFLWQNSHPSD